jgi:hypothetical protein
MFTAQLGKGAPSSASLRMATIWLPIKRDVFMLNFQKAILENSTFDGAYVVGRQPKHRP